MYVYVYIYSGIFCQRGEIIASSNVLEVGGSGGMLPPGNLVILRHLRLLLLASETTFTTKNDKILSIIMIVESFF